MIKPLFPYFGSKWRLTPLYPQPTHSTIIEPFAGMAAYSHWYPDRNVILADSNPVIAGVWDYLTNATPADIMALPSVVDHIDDVRAPQEAKHLIGFWLMRGAVAPGNIPTQWSTWGGKMKHRIASQLCRIRHWHVMCCDYMKIPNVSATWFVDPPYANNAGRCYPEQPASHEALGRWCYRRRGQVIVCEGAGATWLPFDFLTMGQTSGGKYRKSHSVEMIWTNTKGRNDGEEEESGPQETASEKESGTEEAGSV